jgi:hypothetical protein
LEAYERFPWNDEVPIYFARLFYADFFLGMHPDYTILPSRYYGVGKGRTYDRKWECRDASLPRPPPPLVSLPTGEFASHAEMQATSQVGKEARTAIKDNLEFILYGIDVGLNTQRAQSTA